MNRPMPKNASSKACSHPEVVLFGSEETGLRRAECGRCHIPMTRTVVDGGYDYRPISARGAEAKART